ncbi:Insulin-degrading enzyme [Temnothorax longispinosus]|uniref:Insulin-degrading enzyme n=1 Tax=Temnothorax longispinosus TaxID=300112 RepID=A0A4S2KPT8_9HYME|nr:Insulin-degrading enzyme [Temnothorax longispinosus]
MWTVTIVTLRYNHDPDDLPGLANLCEHILDMGTVGYPKQNDYDEHLWQHGGGARALRVLCPGGHGVLEPSVSEWREA